MRAPGRMGRVVLAIAACSVLTMGNAGAQPAYPCSSPVGLPDADADGIMDACDCDAADDGAFWRPSEVTGLTLELDGDVVWDALDPSPGDDLTYDALQGELAAFLAGDIGTEVCLADDIALPTTPAPDDPPAGTAFYYLARGNNVCGGGDFAEGQVHAACTLPDAAPPESVGRVRGVIDGVDVILTWEPVPGADDYAVYKISPAPGAERYGDCLASPVVLTTFTDVGALAAAPPLSFTYIVVARNVDGESALGWDGLGRSRVRLAPPCP